MQVCGAPSGWDAVLHIPHTALRLGKDEPWVAADEQLERVITSALLMMRGSLWHMHVRGLKRSSYYAVHEYQSNHPLFGWDQLACQKKPRSTGSCGQANNFDQSPTCQV